MKCAQKNSDRRCPLIFHCLQCSHYCILYKRTVNDALYDVSFAASDAVMNDAVNSRGIFLLALFFGVVLCFYNLGSLPLFDQDEPRYASAARTMLETGNYIVPYFNGQPRYQKPVFIYWLMCGSFKLFGVNEFAARFPSALAVVVLIIVTFVFGRVYLGSLGASIAALSLATSFGIVVSGHVATTDAVLHLLIAGSFMSFFHAEHLRLSAEGKETEGLFWYALAYALSGFAVLTKGPIGFLLPIIGIGSYWLFTGRFLDGLKNSHIPLGLLIILLINLPWWVLINAETNGEFLRVFILRENLQRFAAKEHAQPLWYFIPVLFVFFFPWSIFVPQGWLYGIRISLRKLASPIERLSKLNKHEHIVAYCTFWSLSIIIFFSISKGKNPQYILPSFAALALLCGWWFERFFGGRFDAKQLRRVRIALVSFSMLLTLLSLSATSVINKFFKERFTYGAEPVDLGWGIWVAALAIAICGLTGLFQLRERVQSRVALPLWLACLMVIVNLSLASTVAPSVAHYRQEPLRDFAVAIGATARSYDAVVVFRRDQSSIVYYSRLVVMRINDVSELERVIRNHRRTFIIAKRKDLDELLKSLRADVHVIQERLAYALLIAKPLKATSHK
ncbi:MAG: glycosyltransferase family 39 protein [Armatimonadetes bacterium]|nr:glycosyltransferase family 39 protein [Armatimonadota bacterium]MCX7777898.1 glycosyltransferase family 39 protein [Armatimonadota bacterium]